MRESVRLTVRMHRFELLALGGFVLFLVVASLFVAGRLDAVGFGPECTSGTGPVTVDCERLGQRFYEIDQSQASPLFALIAILPYAAGLFLGGPVVAREIERGTTRLAWSIAPSRLRWYLARMIPIVVAVVVLAFVAGLAAERLFAARSPGVDSANAFDHYGLRGGLIAVQAFVMAAGAIGLGAVTGRVLPTVILALVLGVIGLNGVASLHERFTRSEAVIRDDGRPGDRYVDQFFKLPDGRLVGWDQLAEIDPASMNSGTEPQYPTVSLVVPGERYREVEAREAAILGAIGLAMLSATSLIVQHRRPN